MVPSKGIFKDFSSGKGGDAITFVMEHEKMSYSETIRYLAAKYGVEIKEDASVNPEEFSQQESLYIAMGFARDFFQKNLTEKEEGQIGLNYFQMERRFSDAIIRKFELGYAL
ncbi:MAG: DNA primase, partial [Candidatus Nephrothrix sp. EaCA]